MPPLPPRGSQSVLQRSPEAESRREGAHKGRPYGRMDSRLGGNEGDRQVARRFPLGGLSGEDDFLELVDG